jgi:hypothetical protein
MGTLGVGARDAADGFSRIQAATAISTAGLDITGGESGASRERWNLTS